MLDLCVGRPSPHATPSGQPTVEVLPLLPSSGCGGRISTHDEAPSGIRAIEEDDATMSSLVRLRNKEAAMK